MARREQTVFPDWWHELQMPDRLRERLRAQFTIHRDGYLRWYAGAPRFVCGKNTPPEDVEQRWHDKKRSIDKAPVELVPVVDETLTYRKALANYLSVQKARVGASKNKIELRTYQNYVKTLNDFGKFVVGGQKLADMPLVDIGPEHFTQFAGKFAKWKPSGFDSTVCLVGALFRWAVEMEYIDRYRPGPMFCRPAKQELRDARIGKEISMSAEQIAKLYNAAGLTMKCWIALGVCAGFINSDIGSLSRQVIDMETGIIDFRRRKTGKVRRVIPLPSDVVDLLKLYKTPVPADPSHAELIFLTEAGKPYVSDSKPTNTISILTRRLMLECGMKSEDDGRGFKAFRTSLYNLAPRSGYMVERDIIMGHAQGTIGLDNYLEDVGIDRLRHVVNHVWDQIKSELSKLRQGSNTEQTSVSPSPGATGDSK